MNQRDRATRSWKVQTSKAKARVHRTLITGLELLQCVCAGAGARAATRAKRPPQEHEEHERKATEHPEDQKEKTTRKKQDKQYGSHGYMYLPVMN